MFYFSAILKHKQHREWTVPKNKGKAGKLSQIRQGKYCKKNIYKKLQCQKITRKKKNQTQKSSMNNFYEKLCQFSDGKHINFVLPKKRKKTSTPDVQIYK